MPKRISPLSNKFAYAAQSALDDIQRTGGDDAFVEAFYQNPELTMLRLSQSMHAAFEKFNGTRKDSLQVDRDVKQCLITEKMIDAGHSAVDKYDEMIKDRVFPRPIKVAFVYEAMFNARHDQGFKCPIGHDGCTENCGSYGCGN